MEKQTPTCSMQAQKNCKPSQGWRRYNANVDTRQCLYKEVDKIIPDISSRLPSLFCFHRGSVQSKSPGLLTSAGAKGSWVCKMWWPQSVDSFESEKIADYNSGCCQEVRCSIYFLYLPFRYQVNGLKKCFGAILMVVLVTISNFFFWLKIILVRQLKIYIE